MKSVRDHPKKTSARDKHKLLFYFFMFYGKVFALPLVRVLAQWHFYCEWIWLCMEVINSISFSSFDCRWAFRDVQNWEKRRREWECNINNVQIVSDFHPCYKSSLAKCCSHVMSNKKTPYNNASVNAQCIDCVWMVLWCDGGWLLHGK